LLQKSKLKLFLEIVGSGTVHLGSKDLSSGTIVKRSNFDFFFSTSASNGLTKKGKKSFSRRNKLASASSSSKSRDCWGAMLEKETSKMRRCCQPEVLPSYHLIKVFLALTQHQTKKAALRRPNNGTKVVFLMIFFAPTYPLEQK